MTSPDDDALGQVLTLLAGVVVLVIGGVLAVAIGRSASTRSAVKLAAEVEVPERRLCFSRASTALPTGAQDILDPVAQAARADAGKTVLISSWHDAGGHAAGDTELRAKRAEAVRHALEANGVASDKLIVDPPLPTADKGRDGGEGDRRDASCVEIRVR